MIHTYIDYVDVNMFLSCVFTVVTLVVEVNIFALTFRLLLVLKIVQKT